MEDGRGKREGWDKSIILSYITIMYLYKTYEGTMFHN